MRRRVRRPAHPVFAQGAHHPLGVPRRGQVPDLPGDRGPVIVGAAAGHHLLVQQPGGGAAQERRGRQGGDERAGPLTGGLCGHALCPLCQPYAAWAIHPQAGSGLGRGPDGAAAVQAVEGRGAGAGGGGDRGDVSIPVIGKREAA
jgi:hypothetical protein